MRNQRVKGWAAFGFKDCRNSLGIINICAEAVDRIGRKSDQPAVKENIGCFFDIIRRVAIYIGRHLQSSKYAGRHGRSRCMYLAP